MHLQAAGKDEEEGGGEVHFSARERTPAPVTPLCQRNARTLHRMTTAAPELYWRNPRGLPPQWEMFIRMATRPMPAHASPFTGFNDHQHPAAASAKREREKKIGEAKIYGLGEQNSEKKGRAFSF